MTKTKATQAADLYSTARENPYVQRLIEDEELRDSLKKAFEAAKGAYGRATSNGGTVKAVTSDKKVQRDLKVAAENLRDASEAFRAPKLPPRVVRCPAGVLPTGGPPPGPAPPLPGGRGGGVPPPPHKRKEGNF